MRVEVITESEWASLRLSAEEAVALDRLGRRLASSTLWWGESEDAVRERSVIDLTRSAKDEWRVFVREAIGVISVGALQITVQPKIPRDHFVYLALRSKLLPRVDEQITQLDPSKDFWQVVVLWFLEATEKLLRRELSKGYVETTDELDVVRGRILVVPTAQAFYAGRPRVTCEYEEFSENIPLNRVLLAAAEVVACSGLLDPSIRRRAKMVMTRMSEVGELQPNDLRVAVDRNTKRYESALTFAKHLLTGAGVNIGRGTRFGWSFLMRTPELVEAGIREVLSIHLSPRWKVRKARLKLSGTALTLNPDILIEPGPFVADVKYKLGDVAWNRSDLYQAVSFATGFHAANAAIIGFLGEGPGRAKPGVAQVGDVCVSYLAWDARIEVRPEDAAEDLCRQMLRWLTEASIGRATMVA